MAKGLAVSVIDSTPRGRPSSGRNCAKRAPAPTSDSGSWDAGELDGMLEAARETSTTSF